MEEQKKGKDFIVLVSIVFGFILMTLLLLGFSSAVPDSVSYENIANETKTTGAGTMFNISGGHLAFLNITATIQNPHWKAFLGWVHGRFTLDDSAGSTIYDWSLTTIRGSVYATRNSTTANWTGIQCATPANLETENIALHHTSPDDNLTATFNATANHPTFTVGMRTIDANSCPALNTYINNQTQSANFFEMALYDGINIIYSTIINQNTVGYNGSSYDFQMLVPENGNSTWVGSTAYYLYVELT